MSMTSLAAVYSARDFYRRSGKVQAIAEFEAIPAIVSFCLVYIIACLISLQIVVVSGK